MWQPNIEYKESTKLDAIIFDFDGVILDSFSDQYKLFEKMCQRLGKPFPYQNIEEFREDYQEPVYPNMYDHLNLDFTKNEKLIWKIYNKHKKDADLQMYQGAKSMLSYLKNNHFRLAIASSNTKEIIERELKKNGLEDYFEQIVTKDDLPMEHGKRLLKPQPDCIITVLSKLSWPKNTLYISDQCSDMESVERANNSAQLGFYGCNVLSAGVTYGYGLKKKILESSPDILINNVKGILAAIDFMGHELNMCCPK